MNERIPQRIILASAMRLAAIAFLIPLTGIAFEPPSAESRRAAVGNVHVLPPAWRRAFDADSAAFEPIPKPALNDWLAAHPEPGQTFDQYLASRPNRPTRERRTIYVQPIGEFAAGRSPSIETVRDFAHAFFAMEVKTLSPVPVGASFTARRNPNTGGPQILTGDVLNFLKTRLPADAFCILAVTMEDLYPAPSWNFVFGQASLRDRVGVYSFARYDPAFYGEVRGADAETLILARSCKVFAHETGHMFGILHCTHFNCLMNGSNHLNEADRRPLHLCPVCLRKLQWNTSFDVVARYTALEKVSRAAGFTAEAEWLEHQLRSLRE